MDDGYLFFALKQSDDDDQSLLPGFIALVLALTAWLVILIIFFPRWLGRLLSFLANRASRGTFHVRIPTIHIYPLAGRAVAHAVRYTTPDLSVSVEELVLQCRWWRRQLHIQENPILTGDPPDTLNPVALAQEQMERENSATFLKRLWYRVRRLWHRTAVTKDAVGTSEQPPLISLVLVALRVRCVNNQRNYNHVKKVLAHARTFTRRPSLSPTDENFNVRIDDVIMDSSDDTTLVDDTSTSSSSEASATSESYSSDASFDEKPFVQRILELASLRITDGTFYICDMGQSPLALLSIDSAKMLYRYGAPACPADECRKRIQVVILTLKVSVADNETVRSILDTSETHRGDPQISTDNNSHVPHAPLQDNTDRMIRRVISKGHLGIVNPFWDADEDQGVVDNMQQARQSKRSTFISRLQPFPPRSRRQIRLDRKGHALSCVDLLHSKSAVVDYVFDEPGPSPEAEEESGSSSLNQIANNRMVFTQEEASALPPPACRVSVLLHRADFKYDVGAIADLERVIERLQPLLYDFLPLANQIQKKCGKRVASGMQIDIEATPVCKESMPLVPAEAPPLVTIPFSPTYCTWMGLCAGKVREWGVIPAATGDTVSTDSDDSLPPSQLEIRCSMFSIRTEIPFQSGVRQEMLFTLKDTHVTGKGVVDLPLLNCEQMTVSRVIRYPQLWNEEHIVSTDVSLLRSELLYVPDFIRIINDVGTTFQSKSRKPPAVNYFVPYKETTKILAEDNYCVILPCSRDNAWKDIHNGVTDEFGRLKLCGESGEIVFSPNMASEYHHNMSSMTWSLSLPNLVGKLNMLLPSLPSVDENADLTGRPTESTRIGHYKVRTPSLARRARSQPETTTNYSQLGAPTKAKYESVDIGIFRFDGKCKLKAKALYHENRSYLSTTMPAFLDAVNTNDLSFSAENLTVDLNPHHTTHILNVIRNYNGQGTHTITALERSARDERRNQVAADIIQCNRYPSLQECLILGLPQSYTLPSSHPRPGIDDLFRFSFQIDSALVRLHDLPHAASPFDLASRHSCSLFCDKLEGMLCSSRLGMEFTIQTGSRRNVISVQGGCHTSAKESIALVHSPGSIRLMPTATVEDLQVRMSCLSSKNWSTYFSSLSISVGKVSGCFLDISVASLSRFACACIPKSLPEGITSVGALLSIDNIEVRVGMFDLLILSSSSTSSAERSAQINTLFSQRQDSRRQQEKDNVLFPKFLAGVTQVRLQNGLRVVSSTLAYELEGFLTRVVVPNFAFDILVPSGGMLTPWVDDATLRAQVAHATLPMWQSASQDLFPELGVMHRAVELRDTRLEIIYSSKPSLWNNCLPQKQCAHVLNQNEISGQEKLPWCLRKSFHLGEQHPITESLRKANELDLNWWQFLDQSEMTVIVNNHRRSRSISGSIDSLLFRVSSDITMFVSPELLELVCEVAIRFKELGAEKGPLASDRESEGAVKIRPEILTEDILNLWKEFERARLPHWVTKDLVLPSTSFKVLDTCSVTVYFLSPMLPAVSSDGNSFSNTSNGNVFLSIPSGVHVFAALTLDIRHSELVNRVLPGRPWQNVVWTNALHISTPSVTVGCSDAHLVQIKDILLIKHDRNALCLTTETARDVERLRRRDRTTLVGKIGMFKVGQASSSLGSYASFGRIASIFLLLSRAVRLEVYSFELERMRRSTLLCESMMSCSAEEMLVKEPQLTRSFFVIALKSVQSSLGYGSWTDQLPLSEHRFPSCNIARRDEIPIQSTVHSIDISLRNISLLIMNQEILQSDVFSCKGGKTYSPNSQSSELEGYVLNASLGSVSLSIRDDVAADTLEMVSKVASYVQKATVSIPMLRQENYPFYRLEEHGRSSPDSSHENFKGDEVLASSSNGDALFRSSLTGGSSIAASGQRLPRARTTPKRYRSGLSRIHEFYHRMPVRSSQDNNRAQSMNVERSVFSLGTTSNRENGSSRVRKSNSQQDHLSSDDNEFRGRANVSETRARALEPIGTRSAVSNASFPKSRSHMGVIREDEFTNVSVRTAGDSGPPQKRSKCMIPLTPTVPPAFSDSAVAEPVVAGLEIGRSVPVPSYKHTRFSSFSPRRKSPKKHASPPVPEHKTTEPTKISPNLVPPDNCIDRNRLPKASERPNLTLFVSCREIVSRYYRKGDIISNFREGESKNVSISFLVHGPRLTLMSQPSQRSHSVVMTASSAKLFSSNNPHCTMTGSIAKIGMTVSLAPGRQLSLLPKLISSCRVSEFKATLQASDLQSVLKFRKEFKMDLKGLLAAFLTTKQSISEMARATRLSSSRVVHPNRTTFSTVAFDVLFERSEVILGGFHPKDSNMSVSYVIDGVFFSVVASEDDNAALTLGLRFYGHGLLLSSPSWPQNEYFRLPSLDLHGVQWGETTGLPTILKVTAEPLVSSTSFQGLRHVVFTLSGLLAFQNTAATSVDAFESCMSLPNMVLPIDDVTGSEYENQQPSSGTTPFTRSFVAWERTKGVRMDISIRPMSLSLASGQVVALFDVDTITGICEWDKLVVSGVQLRASVSIPKLSLSFMRMPTSDFSTADVRPDERRTSLSVVLERSRIDLLKTQADLTHKFIFRTNVSMILGQVRPWRLLLDAAVWADEQEFVSDLQSINYSALSASRQWPLRNEVSGEETESSTEHRLILFGANIQRVVLAVPLLNSEQYGTSRLAIRATELHVLARHRFDSLSAPRRNIFEVKSHFLGILWENSSLLSSHHAQVTVGVQAPSPGSIAHFGALDIVMAPGTWRICPRRDVVMAILDAKNRKDNKVSDRLHAAVDNHSNAPSFAESSLSVSNVTEKGTRLLVENLSLKILRTSGFIEGLEDDTIIRKSTVLTESLHGRKDSEKVAIPAFSISAVRSTKEEFDLIDVDFSGREGQFPKGCLQRVANLFSDLFGAVASDQQRTNPAGSVIHQEQAADISRNVSVLIRFGRSLYRAQEEANLSIESEIGLFAGKSSAILVSVTTDAIVSDDCSYSTVITGVSPKLALEITPVLDGAQVQSLRLVDARFLHGICPCHAPHTVLHINRVTALMEAKTLLLTENRMRQRQGPMNTIVPDMSRMPSLTGAVNTSGRQLMFILGLPLTGRASTDVYPEHSGTEANIRLQLRMAKKANEGDENQTDLVIDRIHVGINRVRVEESGPAMRLNVHAAVHELLLRGRWDILSCQLRVRENLTCYDVTDSLNDSKMSSESSVAVNIINRLNVENLQYGKHTLKLLVDAVAALWTAPIRNVIVESTNVHSEVSHTLRKAIAKLIGQWKKLRNEVKLLTERDANRKGKVNSTGVKRSSVASDGDGTLASASVPNRMEREMYTETGEGTDNASIGSDSSGISAPLLQRKRLMGMDDRTKVSVKGDKFVIMMRGYQFDETRHSAMVSLLDYRVHHVYDFDDDRVCEVRNLEADFKEMIMSYNDDEMRNCSELFRIPRPALKLSIREESDGLYVGLLGDLEVRLGHGFYNYQEFKELLELTVSGIAPAPPREGNESETASAVDTEATESVGLWDGREAQVIDVQLNPRIDVIGDLTADVLPMMSARLKTQVDGIPKQMYDYLVIPLESFSKAMCDPLFR